MLVKKMLQSELKFSYSIYPAIPFPYQIKQIIRIHVNYNSYLCCKNIAAYMLNCDLLLKEIARKKSRNISKCYCTICKKLLNGLFKESNCFQLNVPLITV